MRKAQDHSDEVLKVKRELIERAKALRESTDWETTAEGLQEAPKGVAGGRLCLPEI